MRFLHFLLVFLLVSSSFGSERCDWGKGEIDLVFFLPDLTEATCVSCPENCIYCAPVDQSGTELFCQLCEAGYYLDKNFECQLCYTGCLECSGPTVDQCSSLFQSYYYDEEEASVKKCEPEGCNYCSMDGSACNYCKWGYQDKVKKVDGKYVVEDCIHCDFSEESCLFCIPDIFGRGIEEPLYNETTLYFYYYFDYYYESHKEALNKGEPPEMERFLQGSEDDGQLCLFCQKDYILDLETGECNPCSIENCDECYAVLGSTQPLCWQCDDGYYLSPNETYCLEGSVENCQTFEFFLDMCKECKYGFIKITGECFDCQEEFENCLDCSAQPGYPVCTLCESGFMFDDTLMRCVECQPNCAWCEYQEEKNEEVVCGQCIAGYSYDPLSMECVEACDVERCKYCTKDGGCAICLSGYYYSEGSGECEPCHESCYECYGPKNYQCSL